MEGGRGRPGHHDGLPVRLGEQLADVRVADAGEPVRVVVAVHQLRVGVGAGDGRARRDLRAPIRVGIPHRPQSGLRSLLHRAILCDCVLSWGRAAHISGPPKGE